MIYDLSLIDCHSCATDPFLYAGTFFDVRYVKDIDRQGQGPVDFLHEADKTKAAQIAIHQQVNITFCVLRSLCVRTKQDSATDRIA